MGVRSAAGPDISGISIDSRQIQPGDLFVALTGDPGPKFHPSQRSDRDGHDFVTDAITNGAAGVLVHDDVERDVAQLRVPDTLDGLWALGRAARARLTCPVVAVTGSSGKTTTKALLAKALPAFATSGSLNNHLGVPLSLALTPEGVNAAVFEIGTSHPGEIAPLSELVAPDVAIVLNVHPAHAEYFAGIDEIRVEKLSIYNGLHRKGHLIVEDSIDTDGVPNEVRITRFGHAEGVGVRCLPMVEGKARYEIAGKMLSAHIPGGGDHRAQSLAAVLAVLLVLKRNLQPALELGDELIPAGRGQIREVAGITLIDDSYNANPASMYAALAALAGSSGRRYAVLGEMRELGEGSAQYHRDLAGAMTELTAVICVGHGMMPLYDALPEELRCGWYASADDALVDRLSELLEPGDRVLIKGSNRVFWAIGFVELLVGKLGQV